MYASRILRGKEETTEMSAATTEAGIGQQNVLFLESLRLEHSTNQGNQFSGKRQSDTPSLDGDAVDHIDESHRGFISDVLGDTVREQQALAANQARQVVQQSVLKGIDLKTLDLNTLMSDALAMRVRTNVMADNEGRTALEKRLRAERTKQGEKLVTAAPKGIVEGKAVQSAGTAGSAA